ncbi:MAG: LppP/LprE family lipoprotein [Mycobacterium sp.]
MLHSRLITVLITFGLLAVGCGWSPPSAPPPKTQACAPSDAPSAETVQQAIAGLPPGLPWRESSRGHTPDCRLNWVVATGEKGGPDSPQQVLFFDRNNPLGSATPEPRPYITVTTLGDDTVNVQYQWRQGGDEPCCPTGIGTVRFRVGDDGKLNALDPIPKP